MDKDIITEIKKDIGNPALNNYVNYWDITKKKKNFFFVLKVYEFFLNKLAKKLNMIHNIKLSNKDWRFLIGEWLFYFISDIFFKYKYLKNKKFNHKNLKNFEPPLETKDFLNALFNKNYHKNIFKQLSNVNRKKNFVGYISLSQKFFFKEILRFLGFFFLKFYKKKYLINTSYMSLTDRFLILYYLKDFPFLFFHQKRIINFQTSLNLRNFNLINNQAKKKNNFFNLLSNLIPRHIPKNFLENFNFIKNNIYDFYPNYKLKIIFSANYQSDDIFRYYCIKNKNEKKTKILLGQHGGGFFSQKFHFLTYNNNRFFDNQITLGYKKKLFKPIFFLKKKKIKPNFNGKILFINYQYVKYPHFSPSGKDNYKYIDDTVTFLKTINNDVAKYLAFKSYSREEFKNTFNKIIKKFKIQTVIKGDFFNALKNSRICICTADATTDKQVLNINFPTIIFFDKNIYELSSYGKKSYDLLEKAGVYYNNPKEAANKLNEIWQDINSWWFEGKRQRLITEFCNRMCIKTKKISLKISDHIKKIT